jgi:hypothetical protein
MRIEREWKNCEKERFQKVRLKKSKDELENLKF